MTERGPVGPTEAVPVRAADGTDAVNDPTSRWERRFCVGVFIAAAGVGVALVATGEPLPPIGPLLLLAVLVALSVNLGALFPSEFSATADVALLFAAVVGFAADSPLLGAFVVGLLMGPLDVLHWKQRLFYRMAYNSGSQSLCVLLAAVLFSAVVTGAAPVAAVLAAAAGAALVWTIADTALVTLVLVRRGGTSVLSATRHVLVLNGLAVPFAIVGAAAGLLARDVGWWAAALVLAPMPFVPDLVLVRARRVPLARAVRWLRLPVLAACVVAVGLAASDVDVVTLLAFAVISVVVGTELRPDRGSLVAPLVSTMVVAAVIVAGGRDGLVVAALVAAAAVGAAQLERRSASRFAGARALAVGVIAAVAGAGVYEATAHHGRPSTRMIASALVAGVTFELAVITLGSTRRRVALARAAWSVPVVAVAGALAFVWTVLGSAGGAPTFAALVLGTLWAVAWWGAPPWTSGWIAQFCARRRGRRIVLVATAAAAIGAALVAVGAGGHVRTAMVLLSFAAAQGDVAMAAVAVRQWRFAPRRRSLDTSALALALLGLTFGYSELGFAGSAWSLVVLTLLVTMVIAVAWPLGGLADRAAGGESAQRIPERRNASA